MKVEDLDNSEAKLDEQINPLKMLELIPQFESKDVLKEIEADKQKYITTGGKAVVFAKSILGKMSGVEDKGKDIKVTFVEKISKALWVVSGAYGCVYAIKGSEEKYQLQTEANVERVWIDGNEVPFSKQQVNLSNLLGKLVSDIGISAGAINIKFDALEPLCNRASKQILDGLGIQDKNVTKTGKLSLPNVVEQKIDLYQSLLCIDDETEAEITPKLKKDVINSLAKGKRKESKLKAKLKEKDVVNKFKDVTICEPANRPQKILNQEFKINDLFFISLPFYHFRIEGRGKIKDMFVNSITKEVHGEII